MYIYVYYVCMHDCVYKKSYCLLHMYIYMYMYLDVCIYFVADAIATDGGYFGVVAGPIFLDNVNCTGVEDSILDCLSQDPGLHRCVHSQDSGVLCPGEPRSSISHSQSGDTGSTAYMCSVSDQRISHAKRASSYVNQPTLFYFSCTRTFIVYTYRIS